MIYTANDLINFEKEIVEIFKQRILPFMMHLSGGNENELIELFKEIKAEDYVFSTHRSHYHFLLKGGNKEKLIEKIKNNKSMFVFDKDIRFLTSSILAGTCCIATGVAYALKLKNSSSKVWCFIGDGAEDEGHFYEAVKYVESLQLPCTFIIEDNDRSVDSSRELRGSTYVVPWPKCVRRYHYKATFPHSGPGLNETVQFDQEICSKFSGGVIHQHE